jgi:Dolichyl-phosphate-mannose-protein mannosyltransferase
VAAIDRSSPPATLGRRVLADRTSLRLAAVPAWAWLAIIVVASAAVEARVALRLPGPRIFGDELIYWELARSFSATGHFALRGVPSMSYGIGYPVLIAPVFSVFKSLPAAYEAVKVVNALIMSSAALPAYWIARRVLDRQKALVAAALAVLVPSMVYTGTIMTENAFYPAFLFCVLTTLRALESPTIGRQFVALASFAAAFLIRTEAVALLPAYITTVAVLALLEPGSRRRHLRRVVRTYRSTWALLLAGSAVGLAVEAANDRTPLALLGAYDAAVGKASFAAVPKWFVYHLADLDLYLGFVPVIAAFAVTPLAFRANAPKQLRLFVVAAVSFVFWITLLVATFSTVPAALGHLHERNLFYVAPLFVIMLLVWVADGGRRWPLAGAVVAALLPAVLPFSKLVTSAASDSLALIPWASFPWQAVPLLFVIAGCVAAAASYALRLRYTPLLVLLVVLSFEVIGANARWQADTIARGFGTASSGRDWIDRAVTPGADVAEIWVPAAAACKSDSPPVVDKEASLWRNEFFNRSVGKAYYIGRAPADNLPAVGLRLAPDGVASREDGKPLSPRYVLVDDAVRLRARVVAHDVATGSTLYQTSGRVDFAQLPRCRSMGSST